MTPTETKKLKVFFSYSHKDERLRAKLAEHLSLLRRQEAISEWYDREITGGSDFDEKISKELNEADIILLLISPSFIASDYCYDKEMKAALERHQKGEARVVPIILRSCEWRDTPFGKLSALPRDGKPITMWNNQDEAFLDVTNGIGRVVQELQNSKLQNISATDEQRYISTNQTRLNERQADPEGSDTLSRTFDESSHKFTDGQKNIAEKSIEDNTRQKIPKSYWKVILTAILLLSIILIGKRAVIYHSGTNNIVIGFTDHSFNGNLDTLKAKYQKEIADPASQKLDSSASYKFTVTVKPYDKLTTEFIENKIDIAFLSPYQYLIDESRINAHLVKGIGWKRSSNKKSYFCVLLTNVNSKINEIEEIKPGSIDKVIFLQDVPNSASTRVIPSIVLYRQGLANVVRNADYESSREKIINKIANNPNEKIIGAIDSEQWDEFENDDSKKELRSKINKIPVTNIPIPFDAVLINKTSILAKIGKSKDPENAYQEIKDSLVNNIDFSKAWIERYQVFKDFVSSGVVVKISSDQKNKLYKIILPPEGSHDLNHMWDHLKKDDNYVSAPAGLYVYNYNFSSDDYGLTKCLIGKGMLKISDKSLNEAEFTLDPADKETSSGCSVTQDSPLMVEIITQNR